MIKHALVSNNPVDITYIKSCFFHFPRYFPHYFPRYFPHYFPHYFPQMTNKALSTTSEKTPKELNKLITFKIRAFD